MKKKVSNMNEIIIPNFKDKTELQDFLNENLSFLYIPDKILELNNEISKLENAQELRDEYFSQLTSFSFDVYNLEQTFENNKYNFEQKLEILFRRIEFNYKLISSWYKDLDFREIVQNDLILKNLILIYKHTGKDPIKFIKEQKQAGLKNNMITGILNFDTLNFLLRLLQKNITNLDPNDLASDLFKEILATGFIQHAFKICIESIKSINGIDNIPSEAFNNPHFIEIIYLGNPNYITISNVIKKLSMEDINNIIKLKEIFYENYPKMKNNPLLNKEHGMDEDMPFVNDFFGIKTTNNNNYYYEPQEQINLSQFFPENFFTSDYLRFISLQLVIFFINTNNKFKTYLIDRNPQLATIFAISNPEKYPIFLANKTNFINEAINIVKNQPKYFEQVVKIFSGYSIDNVLLETISKNDYIQKNYPNFLELVIEHKMVYIKEKTQIDPQNINPKAVAATK